MLRVVVAEPTINVPLTEHQLRFLFKSLQYLDQNEADHLERITAIEWSDLCKYLQDYKERI